METSYVHFDYDWEFNDSSMAKTTWNVTGEGVTTPFEIADGVTVPVGVYEHNEAQFSYNSNRGAPVSFGVRTTIGGFFGGDRVTWGPSVDFRAGDTVNASIRWSRNDITLPGGSFVTNLTTSRPRPSTSSTRRRSRSQAASRSAGARTTWRFTRTASGCISPSRAPAGGWTSSTPSPKRTSGPSGSCAGCTTPSSRRTASTWWPGRPAAGAPPSSIPSRSARSGRCTSRVMCVR